MSLFHHLESGAVMRKKWLWVAGTVFLGGALIAMVARPAPGRKECEDLKAEIGDKLDAKGVKNYSLRIVNAVDAGEGKVVGSCDGGTKNILYARE
jgi:hypothetical protein